MTSPHASGLHGAQATRRSFITGVYLGCILTVLWEVRKAKRAETALFGEASFVVREADGPLNSDQAGLDGGYFIEKAKIVVLVKACPDGGLWMGSAACWESRGSAAVRGLLMGAQKKSLCTRGCRGYSERNSHSPPKKVVACDVAQFPSVRAQVSLESFSSKKTFVASVTTLRSTGQERERRWLARSPVRPRKVYNGNGARQIRRSDFSRVLAAMRKEIASPTFARAGLLRSSQ
jgi:hypothetical protein